MANQQRQSVADVLGPYLREHCGLALGLIADFEEQLKNAGDDDLGSAIEAEQVHHLRVTIRRIRSVLRVFGEFFSAPEAGRLSDDAGWLAQQLGVLRDLDVLGDRVDAAITDLDPDLVLHDPGDELRRQVQHRRQRASQDLNEAMQQPTCVDLGEQLRHWQQAPAWASGAAGPATKIKKKVKRADQRLARRLSRAATAIRSADPDADELIHAARKSGKRHRYAVEAASAVLGSSVAKTTAARKDLQDLLGDYQDSVQAADFLRDLGGIPGRNGFTFGVLHGQEADHRRLLRKKIVKRAA